MLKIESDVSDFEGKGTVKWAKEYAQSLPILTL